MSTRIRTAELADLPAIKKLAHEVWPKAYAEVISAEQISFMLEWMYSPDSLQKQFESGIQFILIESASKELLGFASFRPLQGAHWKLDKLYVRSDKQQTGLGRQLIEQVLSTVKSLNGTQLELQVNRKNKAVGFYQKLGFHIAREEDFQIGNGFFMNDYIMECPIP
ncbi:MAG: hypothetical protein RL750_919 [Bacteroidota bacterium]|jgi:ribosomal protein S18 acetylase RimI-like enzyme